MILKVVMGFPSTWAVVSISPRLTSKIIGMSFGIYSESSLRAANPDSPKHSKKAELGLKAAAKGWVSSTIFLQNCNASAADGSPFNYWKNITNKHYKEKWTFNSKTCPTWGSKPIQSKESDLVTRSSSFCKKFDIIEKYKSKSKSKIINIPKNIRLINLEIDIFFYFPSPGNGILADESRIYRWTKCNYLLINYN